MKKCWRAPGRDRAPGARSISGQGLPLKESPPSMPVASSTTSTRPAALCVAFGKGLAHSRRLCTSSPVPFPALTTAPLGPPAHLRSLTLFGDSIPTTMKPTISRRRGDRGPFYRRQGRLHPGGRRSCRRSKGMPPASEVAAIS